MTNILVTGGAGYIGSHVCKVLAAQGHNVTALDNLVYGDAKRLQHCPLVVGDITDKAFTDRVFSQERFELVIHLAAWSNPLESVARPADYYHNNNTGTLHILEAMVKHGVSYIIFASSSTVYADKGVMQPYGESDPCRPFTPYAVSKWVGERLIADYSRAYGLRHVIMRHFNPAGANPRGASGELRSGNNHAVAAIVKTAVGIRPVFQFHGTDYPTPDGSSIRDYVHIDDIASAHARAIEYLTQGNASAVINIGSGRGTSLKELVAAVEAACGHAINIEYLPRRDIYQSYLVADIGKAYSLLDWQPQHSDIHTIVKTTLEWFSGKSGG